MALVNGQYTVAGPRGYQKFKVARQNPTSRFFGGRQLLRVQDPNEQYGWRAFAEIGTASDGSSTVTVFRFREAVNQQYAWLLESLDKAGGEVATADGRVYRMTVVRTCDKCNAKLVHPESIERGIGPECSGKGYTNPKGKTAKPKAA